MPQGRTSLPAPSRREPGRIREECSSQRAVQSHVKGKQQELYQSRALSSCPAGPWGWPPLRAPAFQMAAFAPITLPLLHQQGDNEPALWVTRRRSRGAALDTVNVHAPSRGRRVNTCECHVLTAAHHLPAAAAFSQWAGSHPCHVSCRPGHACCSDQGSTREGAVCPPQQRLRRRRWHFCSPAGAATVKRMGPRDWLLHQSRVPKGAAREPT